MRKSMSEQRLEGGTGFFVCLRLCKKLDLRVQFTNAQLRLDLSYCDLDSHFQTNTIVMFWPVNLTNLLQKTMVVTKLKKIGQTCDL